MNNKGFMMAEVIVVSAIVMLTIVGLYQSFNKIYSTYKTRTNYYDSTTLYRVAYYRDILIDNDKLNELIKENKIIEMNTYFTQPENKMYVIQPIDTNEVAFLLPVTKMSELNNEKINLTFKDYLKFLSTSTEFKSNYVMIMERCTAIDNINDCKYAYLEIYDGNEKE